MDAELEAYEQFRTGRLIPDLQEWTAMRDREAALLSEYESLLKRIQNEPLPESLPLDLSDGYEADLSLFSRDLLFLNVGFGFFCQMTRDEARAFLPGKLELLRRLLKRRDAKIQTINRHLATTERVIRELKSLSSSTMNK